MKQLLTHLLSYIIISADLVAKRYGTDFIVKNTCNAA